jgi:tetratricopeptide (TPR) repeat protein
MRRLSLCMIVRNEAASLRTCLDSARPHVDEIVVADTGSDDATVAIAQEYGARVIPSVWRDDFAAARNRSLAPASGDWILVLDADERLTGDAGSKLRALLDAPDEVVAYLLQQRTPTASSAVNGMLRVEWLPRLFRNGAGARYVGPVHECVLPSLAGRGRVVRADVAIEHDGYLRSADAVRAKALRNLRILLRGLERDPEDALAWLQVGDCHACLGDADSAVDAYRAGLDLAEPPATPRPQGIPRAVSAAAWQQLGAALLIRGEAREAVAALGRALQLWPALASAHVYLGQAYARLDRWEQAIAQYELAVNESARSVPSDQPVYLAPWFAWHLKGAAEARLGRMDDAERSLAEALRLHPDCADARRLLQLVENARVAAPSPGAIGLPVGAGSRG